MLPTIRLYPQSAFTHNLPLPTIHLYPQSAFTWFESEQMSTATYCLQTKASQGNLTVPETHIGCYIIPRSPA